MKTAAITALVYGAFIAIGGIAGYVSKNSLPSLISGGAIGVLTIGCGLAMRSSNAGTAKAAWVAALVLALAVLGRFGSAFAKSGDWWPAGITAIMSILAIIGLVVGRK